MSDKGLAEAVVVERGEAPLLLAHPHVGTALPADVETRLISSWRARCDTDWHTDQLYAFARDLGATIVRGVQSRSVIDVNRDPSGASLYPGLTTTGLCPTETFEGEPLWRDDEEPTARDVELRKLKVFNPFHRALAAELARLRANHPRVVLYDCHSIRSRLPRLFEGELPAFNLGTNSGRSCSPALTRGVADACRASALGAVVVDGRFRGGWITRHYGRPKTGTHAIQMELAMRGYLREPESVSPENWPVEFDPAYAAPMQEALRQALVNALAFARSKAREPAV